jgi:hypothetical protein
MADNYGPDLPNQVAEVTRLSQVTVAFRGSSEAIAAKHPGLGRMENTAVYLRDNTAGNFGLVRILSNSWSRNANTPFRQWEQ